MPINSLIYPSAATTVLLSPADPCGSDGGASSSSDEPALDDSSSLSASIHSLGLELKNTPAVLLNANHWAHFSSSMLTSTSTLTYSTEEYESQMSLTLPAVSLESCEPHPLHLYPACTGSSSSPGSSEGSLCTPTPAPATGLGDKWREGKNSSLIAVNASDFLTNFDPKPELGLEAEPAALLDLTNTG